MSHTCEATFGVPGRGGKGRGGARESRKRGVATEARGLPAFQVLDEIAPPARQVGVNRGATLGEQPTDAVLPAPGEPAVRQIRLACQGVALSMEECLG